MWTEDELLARTVIEGDCRLWAGAKTPRGYGKVGKNNGPTRYVHRLVLEQKIGRPLERTEMACHTCDRPSCINRDHLYVGDGGTNGRDASVRGGVRKRFSYEDAIRIRNRYADGATIEALAAEFGVVQNTIWKIVNRKSFRHTL